MLYSELCFFSPKTVWSANYHNYFYCVTLHAIICYISKRNPKYALKHLFYCVWFKDTVKYKSVRNFHCNQKWNFPDDNVKVSELMTTPKKNPLWTPAWNLFSLLLTIRIFFRYHWFLCLFFFFFRKSTKCDGNFGQIINDNCQFLNEK